MQDEVSIFELIAGFVTVVAVLAFGGTVIYVIFRPLIRGVRDNFLSAEPQELPQNERDFLLNNCKYYKDLPYDQRLIFEDRVRLFIESKQFVGGNDLNITREMKLMTAAAGVQLTFGLNHYIIVDFDKIVLYPDTYHVPSWGVSLWGHVSKRGRSIHMSWKHLSHGMLVYDDTWNLALHEMAHAMHTQFTKFEMNWTFYEYYAKWKVVAKKEMAALKKDPKGHFLRDHAAKDMQEMFAVTIEHFFEQAEQFAVEMPRLYKRTADLLGQDPLDPRLIIRKRKADRHLKRRSYRM